VPDLVTLLDRYRPRDDTETADIQRVRALTQTAADPYRRDLPLHVTASALIVHPPTARVLLRWHQRQQAWLQVGGHGDPGETDPLTVVRREAEEETGLPDLDPWPDAEVRTWSSSTSRPARENPPTSTPTSGTSWPPTPPKRCARRALTPRSAGCPCPRRAT